MTARGVVGACVKQERLGLAVLAAACILLLPGPVHAQGSNAQVIYYGQERAPGVQVTAVNFEPEVPQQSRSGASAGDRVRSSSVPAPVALSAHNCIPRTDARGVSLSYEFFESGVADCVSFVSPRPPEPGPPRRPDRPPRPSPEALAAAAFERVIELAPRPALDVAPARLGLTGFPSFFWVGNDLAPVTATATVPGLTVRAEARPGEYAWDFGDGSTRTTQHPGRAWTRRRDGNVGHLYETKGRYEPTVTVVWSARWRVNGGPWRDLGYFSTTGSIDYGVREMIAVLTRRR